MGPCQAEASILFHPDATHRFTQLLARWNKTGNQSVLRFSPSHSIAAARQVPATASSMIPCVVPQRGAPSAMCWL